MFGLLSGLLGEDPNDPRRRAFLAALGAGLQTRGSVGNSFGAGLLAGNAAYQNARAFNAREAEEKQQAELRRMQMEQMRQAQERQGQMRGAAARAFGPNPNLVANDDEGNAMPQAPGGGGMPEFAKAMMGIDPMMAMQMMPKPKDPTMHALSPGQQLYDSTGKRIAAGEAKAPEVREIKSGNKIFTYERQGDKWVKVAEAPLHKPEGPEKPEKPPQGYRFNPDGSLAFIKGGPADPAGKQTDTERVAAGYHDRMLAAEKIMGKVGDEKGKPGIRESMLMGMGAETVANALPSIMGGRSAERQQYRQAQEDWVRAKLRKESGAVIADAEMDREIRTYFPQIGDTPQALAQKAQARQVAIQAMRTGAGTVVKDSVDDLLRKYLGR